MIDIYFRTTSQRNEKGNRPHWFSFEKCWKNLLDTRQDNPITIIHDGPIVDEYFKSLPENCKLVEINSNKLLPILVAEWEEKNEYYDDHDEKGNVYRKRMEKPDLEKASGALMWEYIHDNLNVHNTIYIIEDDYMHLPNWPIILEDIFTVYNDIHYVALYDHPDKYSQRYTGLTSQIIIGRHCHWRTVPSACGTFAVRGQALFEDYAIHRDNLGDYNKFIKLKEKNRFFVSPLPGIATHCIDPFLGQYVNWEGLANG